jgi:hypothetical protein
MHVLERLFSNYLWLLWVGLLVGRRGARPEERPTPLGSSSEVSRCLVPNRTVLPGWYGSL